MVRLLRWGHSAMPPTFPISADLWSTPVFRPTRIACELLNESGPYQTTLESNTGQVTSGIHLDAPW